MSDVEGRGSCKPKIKYVAYFEHPSGPILAVYQNVGSLK